jgi:hypothetical protein
MKNIEKMGHKQNSYSDSFLEAVERQDKKQRHLERKEARQAKRFVPAQEDEKN